MLDLGRCRNMLLVGLSLGLAVLVIDFALLEVAGPSPGWLIPEHIPMGWNYIEDNDARVAGVLAVSRKGPISPNPGLAIYIGKSTARHGIDPEILDANDGLDCRYLGLWGQGSGLQDLGVLARPLLESHLKPNLALICIHPVYLAGAADQKPALSFDPLRAIARGKWRGVIGSASWNWIVGQRVNINHAIRTVLYNLRVGMFNKLDLNQDAFCSPDPDPWRPVYPDIPEPKDPDDEVRKRIEQVAGIGWFNVKQFDKYRPATEAVLNGVIGGFRDRGAEVVVVLMPETRLLREKVPAEAGRYLEEDLTKTFADAPPVILDFRDAMPDSMFRDHIHLNNMGRKEFSLLLGRAIKEHFEKQRGMDTMSRPAATAGDSHVDAGHPAPRAVATARTAYSDAVPPAVPGR